MLQQPIQTDASHNSQYRTTASHISLKLQLLISDDKNCICKTTDSREMCTGNTNEQFPPWTDNWHMDASKMPHKTC